MAELNCLLSQITSLRTLDNCSINFVFFFFLYNFWDIIMWEFHPIFSFTVWLYF